MSPSLFPCFIWVNQRTVLSFTDIGKPGRRGLVGWEDEDFCFGHINFEMPIMWSGGGIIKLLDTWVSSKIWKHECGKHMNVFEKSWDSIRSPRKCVKREELWGGSVCVTLMFKGQEKEGIRKGNPVEMPVRVEDNQEGAFLEARWTKVFLSRRQDQLINAADGSI